MLSIRPPEYFPRAAYAALLLVAERVVLADTLPFTRQAYLNRARIRTAQGAEWLTVPRRRTDGERPALAATPIDDAMDWGRKHRRALHVHYAGAPFYPHHADALDGLLSRPWPSLGDLTCATVEWLHGALGAPSVLVRASALPGAPDSLAAIWEAVTGAEGGAPPVLLTLPESAARDAERLEGRATVRVLAFEEPARRQVFDGFVPGTSALDLLLNYGPRAADVLLRAMSEEG